MSRPPELLLGATKYGPAVDIWSAGCIFAEFLCGKLIMFGRNEPEQLHKIFEFCGSPDETIWPGVSKMPWYNNFKPARPMRRRLREVLLHRLDPHALDLLDRMLTLDPSKRISAKDALDAEYFRTEPLPCDPKCLPKYESSHEFQTKKKRQQQRLKEEIAKRQKLPYPPSHVRLPPIQQAGPPFQEHWGETNYSMSRYQRTPSSGPSKPYSNPVTDASLPSRYPPRGYNPSHGSQAGPVPAGQYHPHGRAGPYGGSSMPNRSTTGGYAAGPPGYSHGNQYGVNAGHVPNSVASNRNQQYGWQQ